MKSAIGFDTTDPVAEALGDTTAAAEPINRTTVGSRGSPVLAAETFGATAAAVPSSRRLTANAAHIKGAATGPSPPPLWSHDKSPAPSPFTGPAAAGRGAWMVAGAATLAEGAAVAITESSCATESRPRVTGRCDAAGSTDGVAAEAPAADPEVTVFAGSAGIPGCAVAGALLPAGWLDPVGWVDGRAVASPLRRRASPAAGSGEPRRIGAEPAPSSPAAARSGRSSLRRCAGLVDAPADEAVSLDVVEPVAPEEPLVSA